MRLPWPVARSMSSAAPDDLAALFEAHRADLQASAYRRVGDREVAADIVQDAFLRYAAMGSQALAPQVVQQPRFFLWRIVTNLILDRQRQHARRGAHGDLSAVEDSLADPQPLPEQQAEAAQRVAKLREALQSLPPNCRDALLMNRLDGLGHAQIAQRLGVSASMVSKYIMQALRHCAMALREDADD